jgi:hypothetical protein
MSSWADYNCILQPLQVLANRVYPIFFIALHTIFIYIQIHEKEKTKFIETAGKNTKIANVAGRDCGGRRIAGRHAANCAKDKES